MSNQSPYETLGITEDASFDEIQDARNRLLQTHAGDRQQREKAEAAYDAILMERLRLRQEGKIKVPDRIRFPEKLDAVATPKPALPSLPTATPNWLQQVVDTPSAKEIWWPALVFTVLGVISWSVPALALAIGAGCTLYCLHRKEHRFGRSLLFTAIALTLGVVAGLQIGSLLAASSNAAPESIAAIVTLILFWLTSSFLR